MFRLGYVEAYQSVVGASLNSVLIIVLRKRNRAIAVYLQSGPMIAAAEPNAPRRRLFYFERCRALYRPAKTCRFEEEMALSADRTN